MVEPTLYCVCATVDTGLVNSVVTYETALSKVHLGWVILPNSITYDIIKAEKALRYWNRAHRKLSRVLESKIMH